MTDIPKIDKLKSYHHIWCDYNHKPVEWIILKLEEGFHIHHVDGNHFNDDPTNLVLIYGPDHLMLHGLKKNRSPRVKESYKAECGCECKKRGGVRTLISCKGEEFTTYSYINEKRFIEAYHADSLVYGRHGITIKKKKHG